MKEQARQLNMKMKKNKEMRYEKTRSLKVNLLWLFLFVTLRLC